MENKSNLLKFEKSLYLLQHANNPVNWFPWCEEAFDRAREENKPIFLSIGYSTCHWCHVMEKESFEDIEVAELMNDAFISIKVDREERPDIDNLYMSVCQMMTGGGGWPLTVLMTHEQKPFFTGTYFPKFSRANRIGMMDLVPRVKEAWNEDRNNIEKSAENILLNLNTEKITSSDEILNTEIVREVFTNFEDRFDNEFGGFGERPKFPSPHNLLFLLRYYYQTRESSALDMVIKTLTEMRKGGIYDHIGFGFHRYSTDKKWF